MMRRRMLEEAEVVARGGEPKALIRDPEKNDCVRLPIMGRDVFVKGYSRGALPPLGTPGVRRSHEFVFQAGQPEEIRLAYRRAMGLPIDPAR